MKDNIEAIIRHITERCAEINKTMERYGDNLETFLSDGDYQRSVCFNLAQIGELIKKIPFDFRQQYPEIQWKQISGLRDIVVHTYGKIDHCDIYDIMHDDINELNSFCENWLAQRSTIKQESTNTDSNSEI
jgi:uncharacterized protein with HEPN domain